MLLVDALFLNSPGGITLLKYLYSNLKKKGIVSFFLLDKRGEKNFFIDFDSEKIFFESSLKNRKKFYKQNKSSFSTVLCFSNIPPPIHLSVPVFTFFQNVLLLQDCLYYPIRARILFYLKRKFILYYKNNSNKWIVQTGFTKQLLITKLQIQSQQVEILPFFFVPDPMIPSKCVKNPESFVYPSTGLPHKNHKVLLKAWEMLYEDGYQFELHLTIPKTDVKLIKIISSLKFKGLKIQNHGIIGQKELLNLYQSSEYLIYPSLSESFGLPLMEAIQQKCKVIAADLPYSKETITPTAIFNPYQPSSLKNAILEATSQIENEKKSKIISEDKINSFIDLINSPICS